MPNIGPTLTATGTDPTYIENGGSVSLFSDVAVSTVEAGQRITSLTLTIDNVSSDRERLSFDGTSLVLQNGFSAVTSDNQLAVDVIFSGSTATVSFSEASLTEAQVQQIVENLAYQSIDDDPSTSLNRIVTITEISDDGGIEDGGQDTTALDISATITLAAVNDPPTLDAGGLSTVDLGQFELAAPTFFSLSDPDSDNFDGGSFQLSQSDGLTNGSWGVNGSTVTSGGDAVIGAGEDIQVDGTTIGTVDSLNNGQEGEDLRINFNSDATPETVEIFVESLTYFAPSGAGVREFIMTVNDGDGTALLGDDESSFDFGVNVNSPPTGAVEIIGTPQEGETLLADASSIVDPDGRGALEYTWFANGSFVGRGIELNLPQFAVEKNITVIARYTDLRGNFETVESDPFGPIENVNDEPQFRESSPVGIEGAAFVGSVLSARFFDILDEDGLNSASRKIQWLRDGSPIEGATFQSYRLTQDDVGSEISIRYSYTDNFGTNETISTEAIGPIADLGSATVGSFSIDPISPDEDDVLEADISALTLPDNSTPYFLWVADDGTIRNQSIQPFDQVLGQSDVGKQFSLVVSYTQTDGTETSIKTEPTEPVININDEPEFRFGDTFGLRLVGASLFASHSISDEDGYDPNQVEIEWLRDGSPIADASGRNYTLTLGDIGSEISVRYSYTDNFGTDETITADAIGPVVDFDSVALGPVTISDPQPVQNERVIGEYSGSEPVTGRAWVTEDGTVLYDAITNPRLDQQAVGSQLYHVVSVRQSDGSEILFRSEPTDAVLNVNDLPRNGQFALLKGPAVEGATIEADFSIVEDADGFDPELATYQWLRDDSPIDGISGNTYTLAQGDVGAEIKVVYSYTDDFGTEETIDYGPSIGPIANVNDLPTGSVFIGGTAALGETLIADTSTLADEDGLGDLSYLWVRNASPVAGATENTYTLTEDDIGAQISVLVSYTDGFGAKEQVTSLSTPIVDTDNSSPPSNANSNPAGSVFISGTPEVGETLLAETSGLSDSDGLGEFSYLWVRNATPIAGATESNYTLTQDDIGARISVVVSYTDGLGTSEQVTSFSTAIVTANNQTLVGDSGDNNLSGGPGDDILAGGPGNDILEGGSGFDTFDINPGDGQNTILDFELGIDTLDLRDFDRIDALTAFLNATPGSAVLTFGDGTVVTVEGEDVSPETLSTDDLLIAQVPLGTITGTSGPDLLVGTEASDDIQALASADTIIASKGDDTIDGGPGADKTIYGGEQSSYTLMLSPGSTLLMDRRLDGTGTDELINMEMLEFGSGSANVDFDLSEFDGATGLSQEDFESFIELYIAYFNRAPDAIGLNFWGTAFANGTTLEEMATLFVDQDETVATYPPGTSNNEFATSVYNNVLGRTSDQRGIDFWGGLLDDGSVSRDQFILEVLRGAKSDLKPELGQAFVDQQLADREYLENKIDIGAYFAVHKGMSDVENAAEAMQLFDGTQDSINDAVAAIDGFYADALELDNGEFLMQVVGVLDNPFAVA